ncbi:MAG: glutamate--tRNA ligase [Myxococcaceae bacterium]|nr:glutamate--tRNA ligase [Myxococcaceae bacterium]
MKPRLRFAPSPTGYLHIGGARTALFNWLFARRHGGTFVLRIEDTDQERSTPQSLQAILDGLTWLGIDWDEGPGKDGRHGPYFQMKKLDRYGQLAQQLIDAGWAYRDYSTEDELSAARKAFAAEKGLKEGDDLRSAGFKFTSPWRDKNQTLEKPALIRFKMPRREGRFGFDDLVLGRIEKPYDDFDDFVLLRSDGVPLYNFGCVVDDHDMAITHVGRGQEHINSTFPQLMIYEAFGWEPPRFAHIPLILGQDKEKLSKRRHPEADVMKHKENGILPHALLNFIARLGWSHGNDETFTREQLIEKFDFEHVGKANGVWNPGKLVALNQHWIKNTEPLEVAMQLLPYLQATGVPEAAVDAKLELGVRAFAERSTTLVEMAEKLKPYYVKGVTIDGAAAAKHLTPEGKALLQKAREELAKLTDWTTAALDPIVKTVADANGAKVGAVAQPIRVAATGNTVSPGIGVTLELLGRDETFHRLDAALR